MKDKADKIIFGFFAISIIMQIVPGFFFPEYNNFVFYCVGSLAIMAMLALYNELINHRKYGLFITESQTVLLQCLIDKKLIDKDEKFRFFSSVADSIVEFDLSNNKIRIVDGALYRDRFWSSCDYIDSPLTSYRNNHNNEDS